MSSDKPKSEEQLHYESLISLFKYSVGGLSVLLTVFGTIIGVLTYNNGSEMRDSFEKEKERLHSTMNEMKKEVENQETKLNSKVDKMVSNIEILESQIKEDLVITKSEAFNEIKNIKQVASSEARYKIEEIFKNNNFENYIDNIAKEKMQPRIEKMIQVKFASIDSAEQIKINRALENLNSNDPYIVLNSIDYLESNSLGELNDDQILKIIDSFKHINVGDSYGKLLLILSSHQNQIVYRYYIKQLQIPNNVYDLRIGVEYVMNPNFKYNIKDFEIIMDSSKVKSMDFGILLGTARILNNTLLIDLLNNKHIIDNLFIKDADVKDSHNTIQNFLGGNILESKVYQNSYYLKTVNSILIKK